MKNSVSVIIPAYRSESYIAKGVQSVLAQSHSGFELVIASDDGQDYSRVMQEQGIEDTRLRFVSTGGMGTGVANARTTALNVASGRFIAAMDADDTLHPKALEIMLLHAARHGAAYSEIDLVDFNSGKPLENHNRRHSAGIKDLKEILTSNLHTFAWVVFDREKLPDINWLARVVRWEDMLFFAGCCDALGGMYYEPQALYHYNRRQGSICVRPETAEEFRTWAQMLTKSIQSGELPELKNADVRRLLVEFFASRVAIETEYEKQQHKEPGLDWLQFMKKNRALFYRLKQD